METIRFLVQGSTNDPYEVVFTKAPGQIKASCTCPAGRNGQYCKHRINILQGNVTGIVSGNQGAVKVILDALPGTDVEHALSNYLTAAQRLEEAKHADSQAKKALAYVLRT
jgi:uncharacterized Zn finger protein